MSQDGHGVITLVSSTYLGGSVDDYSLSIAVDYEGSAIVVGSTNSGNFPTVNELQIDQASTDGFIAKLRYDENGYSILSYSTYLGGNSPGESYASDYCTRVVLDSEGNVYVAGVTSSRDFPTLNTLQEYNAMHDVFVAKIIQNSSDRVVLSYSTYLGGNNDEWAYGLAVQKDGSLLVTGVTYSSDFPIIHQFQSYMQHGDVFITKIIQVDGDSIAFTFSSYLGGTDNDQANDIAVATDGAIYITGVTSSVDFPLMSEDQKDQPLKDAFVAKFLMEAEDRVRIVYSTYLGGSEVDEARGVTIDTQGYAYITGQTYSEDFPIMDEYQISQPNADVFVTKFRIGPISTVDDVIRQCERIDLR